jgi:DNA-binding response OmpR family regulator
MATTQFDWSVDFQLPSTTKTISYAIDNELLIGRPDPHELVFSGFDLSPYDGVSKGVSRRHAMFKISGDKLTLIDLGSDNGTMINGDKLEPNAPTEIHDGDIVHFGHLEVTLKVRATVRQSAIKAQRTELNLANAPKMGRGQRVLIVEDDQTIGQLYQAILQKAGLTVQIARDVVNAIRALNNTPALILLDMMLPGVHGVELCRYVRRDANFPSVPIIAISAHASSEAIRNAMESGADVFVAKPPNNIELSRLVLALIQKSETEHPNYTTKKLTGTASLDHITAPTRKDTLIFFVEGQREPIAVVVGTQVTMGRTSTTGQAHIDLEAHGAFEKGVSRTHAVIRRRSTSFVIEDMNSANGTFVNGHSLMQGEQLVLNNGDEIRLGELRMHVYLLAE